MSQQPTHGLLVVVPGIAQDGERAGEALHQLAVTNELRRNLLDGWLPAPDGDEPTFPDQLTDLADRNPERIGQVGQGEPCRGRLVELHGVTLRGIPMLRRMSPDEVAGAGDLEDYADARSPSLWWAVHRPETYAVAALALAFVTLFSIEIEFEVVHAFALNDNISERVLYGVPAAIRGGLALLAIGFAVMSIRAEDEDTTWSAPVARAAVVVALIGLAFAVTTVIGVLVSDTPHIPGFTAPSP